VGDPGLENQGTYHMSQAGKRPAQVLAASETQAFRDIGAFLYSQRNNFDMNQHNIDN
jgi:hypothetical protein